MPHDELGFDDDVMIPMDLVDRFHDPQILPVASEPAQGSPIGGSRQNERHAAPPAVGRMNLILPRTNELQREVETIVALDEPEPGSSLPEASPTDATDPVPGPTTSRTPDEVDPSPVDPTETAPSEPAEPTPPVNPTVEPTEPT
ncbi:hypothetical protein [Paeniglutamicibacter psychrophenolicus]|uniref:Uncharacterized protein n=1 Tax=Paeniglutamicibacter psychrophenolicus TaxID=257454 RepID=A0ABS4WCJ8_9MICC|nr:hypothetical protein [Paeniglutamicibacter psychrophenolicus]MBP2373920.1 hypothetical protein [Paeniglutamicibacter psychrophenolicus]